MSGSTRAALASGCAIVLLAGLYFSFRSTLGEQHVHRAQSWVFRLSVPPHAGEEMPLLKATTGDSVTFVIDSNRAGEVHVHGYERQVKLAPGGEVTLQFVADAAGVFPVHLHDPDATMHGLAALEVTPR